MCGYMSNNNSRLCTINGPNLAAETCSPTSAVEGARQYLLFSYSVSPILEGK